MFDLNKLEDQCAEYMAKHLERVSQSNHNFYDHCIVGYKFTNYDANLNKVKSVQWQIVLKKLHLTFTWKSTGVGKGVGWVGVYVEGGV